VRPFLWLAGIVLVVSFVPPFLLPGTPMQAMALNVLHVTTAAILVAPVLRSAR
jgi:hypothetical protein